MSTRRRRSANESAAGLNLAMIHLLDMSRLKEELKIRSLDTKGNKSLLADRLEEAVRLQKFSSVLPMDNSPVINKKLKLVEVNSLKQKSSDKTPQRRSILTTASSSIKIKRLSTSSAKKSDKQQRTSKRKSGKLISNNLNFQVSNDKNNVEDANSLFVWASEAPIKALQKISHSITTGEIEKTTEVIMLL